MNEQRHQMSSLMSQKESLNHINENVFDKQIGEINGRLEEAVEFQIKDVL